ncbi:dysbindin protein homolog isoform X1 [Onthophagus taurus]|uniref:dysbindin protein homolog isoform X1 n=2 Tax=Onthophagus taurus TaxID=166361 RepID=UPI0039BE06A6
MFNTLKGLLHAGKQILNEETTPTDLYNVNPNIGAEILSHYQQEWAEIHKQSEENASAANHVADEIERVYSKVLKDHENLQKTMSFLSATGSLKLQIDHCLIQIDGLYNDFDRAEKSLMSLDDLIDKVELEHKKIDHRHQLALYKEKKLVNLENARSNLASKHAQNVIEHELKQRQLLKERQQVFQEAFKRDLETYKSLGTIPKIEVTNNQASALEDIQLEVDKEALDQFLDDKNQK